METAIPSFNHPLLHECGECYSAVWRGGSAGGHRVSGKRQICIRGWLLPPMPGWLLSSEVGADI